MGKVKGAFGGLETKGTIGDTYTFADWKGINVVKKKPVPTNPNTTAQQTERNQHSDAVDHWHNTKLTEKDKRGYGLRAQLDAKIMTGFNKFISLFRLQGTSNVWTLLYAIDFVVVGNKVRPTVTADAACDCELQIIRGPGAGYSSTKTLVPDVAKNYDTIDINPATIIKFTVADVNKTSESGYFRAVSGGF